MNSVVPRVAVAILLSTTLTSGAADASKLQKISRLVPKQVHKLLDNKVLGSVETLYNASIATLIFSAGAHVSLALEEYQLAEPLLLFGVLSSTTVILSKLAINKINRREDLEAMVREAYQKLEDMIQEVYQKEGKHFDNVVDRLDGLVHGFRERPPSSPYVEKKAANIVESFYELVHKLRETHTYGQSVEVNNRAEMILNIFMQIDLPLGVSKQPLKALVDETGGFPLKVEEDGLLFNNGSFVSYTDLFGEASIVDYTQEEITITGS